MKTKTETKDPKKKAPLEELPGAAAKVARHGCSSAAILHRVQTLC